MSHKAKRPVITNVSSDDILGSTLSALDTIINDAQQQQQQQQEEEKEQEGKPDLVGESAEIVGEKRRRGDVFAAMAEPHFHTLRRLVLMYGPQLTPALDAMMRRVLLAISSPAVACCACWELAAALGTCFKAGALRLLEELMELMLPEKSMFLLTAPCMADTTLTRSVNKRKEEEGEKRLEENILALGRNMRAFEAILVAVGPFLNPSIMQRAAMRFALEVVISGILHAPIQHTAGAGSSLLDASSAAHSSNTKKRHNNNNNNNNNSRLHVQGEKQQQEDGNESVGIAISLHSICIDVLTTFLLLCRPLPSVVSACAVRVVKEMPGRGFTSHLQSQPSQHEQQFGLLSSISRLSVVLMALRHPHAVPFYLPPVDVVERATRRVVLEESTVITDTPINENHPMQQSQQEEEEEEVNEKLHRLKTEDVNPPVGYISAQHLPLMPSSRVSSLLTQETVHQQRETQRQEETPVPMRPVPSTVSEDEDDEEDIPDIDMDD